MSRQNLRRVRRPVKKVRWVAENNLCDGKSKGIWGERNWQNGKFASLAEVVF